MTGCRSYN